MTSDFSERLILSSKKEASSPSISDTMVWYIKWTRVKTQEQPHNARHSTLSEEDAVKRWSRKEYKIRTIYSHGLQPWTTAAFLRQNSDAYNGVKKTYWSIMTLWKMLSLLFWDYSAITQRKTLQAFLEKHWYFFCIYVFLFNFVLFRAIPEPKHVISSCIVKI